MKHEIILYMEIGQNQLQGGFILNVLDLYINSCIVNKSECIILCSVSCTAISATFVFFFVFGCSVEMI